MGAKQSTTPAEDVVMAAVIVPDVKLVPAVVVPAEQKGMVKTVSEGKTILDSLKFDVPSNIVQIITDSYPLRDRELCYIYILECVDGNYYIGRTQRHPFIRWAELAAAKPSRWTDLHKPVKVVELHVGDTLLEDFHFFRYVRLHGITKVRGGSYHQPELSTDQLKTITTHLETASFGTRTSNSNSKSCTRCGWGGHDVTKCYARKHRDGHMIA